MRSGTNSNCHAPRTSTEAKWEKAKMHNLAESSFIFNCRESSSRIHPQQSQYEKSRLSPSSRPFGDEIWAPVLPMLPFSHSNLPTFIRRISIYPIYMFAVPDVETTAANRPVEHNSVGTLFFFLFFFLQLFYGPRSCGRSTYTMSLNRGALFFFRVIA